ncbi:hypothetical protein PENTCL1PPCAC_403 [Pristionchus entomophagus]|uniref:Carboxylic ester hydrolase n=1 Tax=Pristionchus entomophagus TaxID=358040 RepID=A0AAV5S6X1_9BILA|nr:hypothetical protein PENTCL1PPCAC_403 [Pristionchus entomophagus]
MRPLLQHRVCAPAVRAEVDEGILEGFVHSVSGKDCEVYLGVPFAAPPVGELRFKKPVRAKPWSGVRKCKRFGPRSIQKDMFWDKVVLQTPQSEDCLYLNVFAPKREEGKTYPVFFYIHGGGFMMDSAAKYGYKEMCEQLITKDIIVITIQYRLGFLGFFSLGNSSCKGNFGLWDQIAALEWTKRNVSAFGGDPSRLTVGGQSAGAVSADLLSLSPVSRDLFEQKITMGGSSFCHWAVSDQDEIGEFCRRKARNLGWKPKGKSFVTQEEEDAAMIAYLRQMPAHKFGVHMIGTKEVFSEARLPLSPVIDGEILPAPLAVLRATAPPKPSIGGVGEYESMLFVALGFIRCNGKFLERVQTILARKARGASLKEMQEAMRDIYGDVKGKNKKELARICVILLSDLISNYANYQYMREAQTIEQSTYMYSLDFTSRNMWGFMKLSLPFCERRGTHASELLYLFKCNYFVTPLPMDANDRMVADIMPRLFANFVKHGNPNSAETRDRGVQWDPIEQDRKQVLSICPQSTMKREVFEGRMERLDRLFHKYNLDMRYNILKR